MAKSSGVAGLVGVLLWTVGIGLESSSPDTKTSAHAIGEILILLGFVGIAGLIAGMLLAGLGGRGVFPKVALGIWAFGHLSISIATIVEAATGNADNPFYPVGGLSQILGGIASAIVVSRAGVLRGWKRWTPTAWALTYLGVFATLLGSTGSGPTAVQLAVFGIWLITIAATAAAVFTTDATADKATHAAVGAIN